VTALLLTASLLTLLALVRAVSGTQAGGRDPVSIGYTAVPGDTVGSVASLFASDPRQVARQVGAFSSADPIPSGVQLTVDASRLWAAMSEGSRAAPEALVTETARHMGLEPALALAVAWDESRLDQSARSATGAIGIMQVEPETGSLAARDLARPIDIRLPQDNAVAGVFWLRALLHSYAGDRSAALAAYYEGPGNLARVGYLAGASAYVAHALAVRQALLAADGGLS
jgi:soluble lytic murein transglycosylase-like protein